jgi:hypothetical protein
LVKKYALYEARALSSPVYKFAWRLGRNKSACRRETEISDAGMSFNIPLPLLCRKERKIDVIFVCDASSNACAKNYPELRRARAYMERKGAKFPSIDNPRKISENIVIFGEGQDSGPYNCPKIIYFANPVSVPTLLMNYSKEKFDLICDSMKNLVVENREAIMDILLFSRKNDS